MEKNSTLNFPLEPDSDTVLSDSITGNAGIRVLQVFLGHLFYDASLYDLILLHDGRPLSEPWGKAFQKNLENKKKNLWHNITKDSNFMAKANID